MFKKNKNLISCPIWQSILRTNELRRKSGENGEQYETHLRLYNGCIVVSNWIVFSDS